MKFKNILAYLILAILLLGLGLAYSQLPYHRIIISIVIGICYFLWGIIIHLIDDTLHWPIILEYLGLSLLAVIILTFLSLRV